MLVSQLDESEESERIEIPNIMYATNIAASRDGNHFVVVGRKGINIYTDPTELAF